MNANTNMNMKFNIYGYEWEVDFVDKDDPILNNSSDGKTLYNDAKIIVRKDMDPQIVKTTLIHELTHAVLEIQGRVYQRKFDREDVCEFIGFCGETIITVANEILKHYGF